MVNWDLIKVANRKMVRALNRWLFGGSRLVAHATAMLAICSLAGPAWAAATPKRGATRKGPAARQQKPSSSAVLVQALAANWLGEDDNLYRACQRSNFKFLAVGLHGMANVLNAEQGEFEKAEDFEKRLEKIEGIVNGDRPYVVCLPLSDKYDAPFTYDPDAELFRGEFDPHWRVDLDYKELGSYVGRTRMNVSFRIKRIVSIDYYANILVNNRMSCAKYETSSRVTYQVPVPTSQAAALKASGYIAFVGRIGYPYISSKDGENTPSLDDPEERATREYEVPFAPDRFEIVGPGDKRVFQCKLS